MGYLRINKVVYSGQKYHFESQEFNKNIVVIEGDNGTGKSTLFNLIYYGLGGEVQSFDKSSDVKHLQITSDLDNYVDLFVTISRNSFVRAIAFCTSIAVFGWVATFANSVPDISAARSTKL